MDQASAMKDVIRLYESGERQQALTLCNQILQQQPDHIEAMGYRAALLRELNQTEAAVAAYQALTEALAQEGHYLRAIATAREFDSLEPSASELTTKKLAEQYHNEQGIPSTGVSSDEIILPERYRKENTLPAAPPVVEQNLRDTDEALLEELLNQLEGDTVSVEDQHEADFFAVEKTQVMRPVPPPSNHGEPPRFDQDPQSSTVTDSKSFKTDTSPELQPPPLPPLFNYLDPESIAAVWKQLEALQFPPGAQIIQEGDQGDGFYIIVEGTVRILQSVDDVQEEMGHLGPGQFFGEISLLTPLKRVASVEAVSSCQVLRLSRNNLQSIVVQYPKVHKELRRFIHHRLLQNLVITSLLFFPLSDVRRWELAQRFEMIELPPEHTIVNSGHPMTGFYIVAGGSVDVYSLNSDMEYEFVESLKPGQFFGQTPLLFQQPSNFTIATNEPATLLKLEIEAFQEVLADYPKVHDLLLAMAKTRNPANPSSS